MQAADVLIVMPEGIGSTHLSYVTEGGDLVLLWTKTRGDVVRQVVVDKVPADRVLDVREQFYATTNVATAIQRLRKWLSDNHFTYREI